MSSRAGCGAVNIVRSQATTANCQEQHWALYIYHLCLPSHKQESNRVVYLLQLSSASLFAPNCHNHNVLMLFFISSSLSSCHILFIMSSSHHTIPLDHIVPMVSVAVDLVSIFMYLEFISSTFLLQMATSAASPIFMKNHNRKRIIICSILNYPTTK